MEPKDILLLVTAAIGSIGGIAAYVRGRGQTRVELATQLASEQAQLRSALREQVGDLASQLARLETKLEASEARGDRLEQQQLVHIQQIAALQAEKDELFRTVGALQLQNGRQAEQIASQAAAIDQLTGEKADAINAAQKAMATKDFLERENNVLRQEVQRLRERLPARVEMRQE